MNTINIIDLREKLMTMNPESTLICNNATYPQPVIVNIIYGDNVIILESTPDLTKGITVGEFIDKFFGQPPVSDEPVNYDVWFDSGNANVRVGISNIEQFNDGYVVMDVFSMYFE